MVISLDMGESGSRVVCDSPHTGSTLGKVHDSQRARTQSWTTGATGGMSARRMIWPYYQRRQRPKEDLATSRNVPTSAVASAGGKPVGKVPSPGSK